MKNYDILVIGSGCGNIIVDYAAEKGMKTALVDQGPWGGTCLNTGCIPSKMLIYPADRVAEIQEAAKLGLQAHVDHIDFAAIMERMRRSISRQRKELQDHFQSYRDLDLYQDPGVFVDDHVLEIKNEKIRADKIFIASGARPLIPPLKGLDRVPYLTNESVLQLTAKPESLIIIGAGYIAVEYAHFFAAMGTQVTILQRGERLLSSEDTEISQALVQELGSRVSILLKTQVKEVRITGKGIGVLIKDSNSGVESLLEAQSLMMAVGRQSNADTLNPETTGVETDEKSFIKVDEYLETTSPGIYAVGDANGRQMFRHAANRQGFIVLRNAFEGQKIRFTDLVVPHAIFTRPQIASVGLTEEAARKSFDVIVGRTRYGDTAKGEAMMEKTGFAKVILEKETGRILGFHLIGPQAPELIQEVVNAMASGGNAAEIASGIHIHPALSEVVADTFYAATGRVM